LGEAHFRVPEPTDLMLTIVANAIRRGFYPPRLVVDVAAVSARYADAIDWDRFGVDARTCGLDRRAWIALDLAATWFGAPVPSEHCVAPEGLSTDALEAWLLRIKRSQPFRRIPTRVLWAGGPLAALRAAAAIAADELARRSG
jgi:hypothetical protein